MGLFTPKYPTSDTPSADPQAARRESRRARRDREEAEQRRTAIDRQFKDAERTSKERSARFWESYERRNGPGSVDYS